MISNIVAIFAATNRDVLLFGLFVKFEVLELLKELGDVVGIVDDADLFGPCINTFKAQERKIIR